MAGDTGRAPGVPEGVDGADDKRRTNRVRGQGPVPSGEPIQSSVPARLAPGSRLPLRFPAPARMPGQRAYGRAPCGSCAPGAQESMLPGPRGAEMGAGRAGVTAHAPVGARHVPAHGLGPGPAGPAARARPAQELGVDRERTRPPVSTPASRQHTGQPSARRAQAAGRGTARHAHEGQHATLGCFPVRRPPRGRPGPRGPAGGPSSRRAGPACR